MKKTMSFFMSRYADDIGVCEAGCIKRCHDRQKHRTCLMRVKQQPVRTVRVEQTVFPLKQEGVKPATQISI